MNVKGVVFDFDGPIFDGRSAALKSLDQTIQKFGAPKVNFHVLPLLRPTQLIALVYADSGLSLDRLDEICRYYRCRLEDAEDEIQIHDEVRLTIATLHADGFRLAILSSRHEANLRNRLTRLNLIDFFSKIVGRDTASVSKPDPESVKYVASQLDIAPTELVVVGDSDADFTAAQGAGAHYYHANWSGEPCGLVSTSVGVVTLRDQRDLRVVLSGRGPNATSAADALPGDLLDALNAKTFCFYAGAGVSVPSGIGGWQDHYLPILTELEVRPLVNNHELPDILQLLCGSPVGARRVFDDFRASFADASIRPNSYHFSMQRSRASTIWTSNYDNLFEKAGAIAGFDRRLVVNDTELMQNFHGSSLLIKMNGDFEHAKYSDDLRWDIVLLQEQFDMADNDRREIWRMFEDDYRNSLIVFVGVSFSDPVLRRIITTVRQRIPRTRHKHLFLTREAQHPAEAMQFALHAQNLDRNNIRTMFFKTFPDISRYVARISAFANQPIIGFSGDAKLSSEVNASAEYLPKGSLSVTKIEKLCQRLASKLARKGFRVTSGHGPGVGVPAVSAAFDVDPMRARFYLRKSGTSTYGRTAPAVIVSGDTYTPMRERFINELSLLIAMGGVNWDNEIQLGVIEEIELAFSQQIPIVLLPQAGGHVFDYHQRFLERIDSTYKDSSLADSIRSANEKVWALSASALIDFGDGDMVLLLEDLISDAVGATIRDRSAMRVAW